MRNNRWLKLMVTLAVLGLITAAGSAQAANVPASSAPNLAIGYCAPAPRQAASNSPAGLSSDGAICSEAEPVHVPTTGSWSAAGPANEGATLSLVAFVAQPVTWGDAGAAHPSAGVPASVATGWLAAIANREGFTAKPAVFTAVGLAWGDAGASRR